MEMADGGTETQERTLGEMLRDIEALTERLKVFLLRRSDVAFPDIVESAHSEISKMWVEA